MMHSVLTRLLTFYQNYWDFKPFLKLNLEKFFQIGFKNTPKPNLIEMSY